MATKQRIVWGAQTEWSADGTTYTRIPECNGLAVPGITTEYQDVTSLDSPNGFREFIPGLKDAGEISIPCGYTTAGYNQAVQFQLAGTLIHFRTTLPLETGQTSGDVFEFTGYVTPEMEQNGVGDPIGMNLNIRTSGAPDFTEGAAS